LIDAATGHQWFINTHDGQRQRLRLPAGARSHRQFFTLHFFTAALAIGYSFYQLYWNRLSAYTIWSASR
jgi:hypothetical protein